MLRTRSFGFHVCLLVAAARAGLSAQGITVPPPAQREFRAAWVATVGNIDWPSRPGLNAWEQQQELLAILNKAVALKLNAIVFHVRPGGDALYASPYEPWSQYLSGRQGRASEPHYDPLKFAVDQAHMRGLELHAWFNPYRAHYTSDSSGAARTHILRTNPELVSRYSHFLWMDPGRPEVRKRAVRAVLDVVRRYDVDGVHIDDYFYPYPERDSTGIIAFQDSTTYARYRATGGALSRDDWRRRNVDLLVEALYKGVKAIKPWVKVGISPFGIWRPGNPPQIKGFDAYTDISADSRKWLQNGWMDYLAPQLYWAVDPPAQSYPVLLTWWTRQNPKHRHIWPGLFTGRIASGGGGGTNWKSDEIVRQIEVTRATPGATGHIHFSMKTLMHDPDSLDEKLSRLYSEPALVPASPWLRIKAPGAPAVALTPDAATGEPVVRLTPAPGEKVWLWVVQAHQNDRWETEVIPGWERSHRLPDLDVDEVAVTAVGRTGNVAKTVVKRR